MGTVIAIATHVFFTKLRYLVEKNDRGITMQTESATFSKHYECREYKVVLKR